MIEILKGTKFLQRVGLCTLLSGIACIGCASIDSNLAVAESSSEIGAIFLAPDALKLRPDQIAKIAEEITVLIETPSGSGSGVIVKKSGNRYTVATASHVINSTAKGEELTARTRDGKKHRLLLESAQKIDRADLSLLDFTSSDEHEVAKIGAIGSAKAGMNVYVSGFPIASTAVPKQILRTLQGSIIANSTAYIRNGYQLLYTNPTLPGMSGGAVLNEKGGLIGIHGQAEIDTTLTANEGVAVKTGTNQAVPISYLPYKKPSDNNSTIIDPLEEKAAALIARASYAMNQVKEITDQMDFTEMIEYRGKFQGNPLVTELAKESIRLLDKAIEVKESSHAYYLRATYKMSSSGQYKLLPYSTESALKDLESALQIDDKNVMALVYYAKLSSYAETDKRLGQRGQYEDSLIARKYGAKWNSLAYKDRLRSIVEFRQSWRLDRDVDRRSKNEFKSYGLLQKAMKLDPYYSKTYTEYCRMLLTPTSERARECLDVLDKAITLLPTVASLHHYRGEAYEALAAEPRAWISYSDTLLHEGLASKGEYISERALSQKKKAEKELLNTAIKSYQLATQLDPSHTISYMKSAFAKSRNGDHMGAAKDIGKQIASTSYPPTFMMMRAKYYQDAGEFTMARNEYLQVISHALTLDDDKLEASLILADLYRAQNNRVEACRHFKSVDEIQRKDGKSPLLTGVHNSTEKATSLEKYCGIDLGEGFFGFNY